MYQCILISSILNGYCNSIYSTAKHFFLLMLYLSLVLCLTFVNSCLLFQRDLLNIQHLLNNSEASLHQLTALLDCRGLNKVLISHIIHIQPVSKWSCELNEISLISSKSLMEYRALKCVCVFAGLSGCSDGSVLWWCGGFTVSVSVLSAGCHGVLHHAVCYPESMEADRQQVPMHAHAALGCI